MKITEIFKILNEQYPGAVSSDGDDDKEPTYLLLLPVRFHEIMKYLRESCDLNFDSLVCLSGVDYPDDKRITVVYNLFSMTHLHHLSVKVNLDRENPVIDSAADIWKIANWHERECYDMYGVDFKDHPDLDRLLLPEDWEGFPLRKDYVQPDTYQGMTVKGSLEVQN